jgi:hypothetical protein
MLPLIGLELPIEGLGMGSFINSPYGCIKKGVKNNVKTDYVDGIMYIIAVDDIGYNTELLMKYSSSYKYNST